MKSLEFTCSAQFKMKPDVGWNDVGPSDLYDANITADWVLVIVVMRKVHWWDGQEEV